MRSRVPERVLVPDPTLWRLVNENEDVLTQAFDPIKIITIAPLVTSAEAVVLVSKKPAVLVAPEPPVGADLDVYPVISNPPESPN